MFDHWLAWGFIVLYSLSINMGLLGMILRVGFPKWLTDRWWLLKNWEHLFFWVCLLNQFGKILMKMLLLWMHWLLPHVSCVIVKKRFPVVSAFDTVAFPVIYLDSLDYSFCSFWCWVCVIFLQMLWLEKLNKETSLWCFWVLFGCIYGMRNSFSYEVIIIAFSTFMESRLWQFESEGMMHCVSA